LYIYYLVAINFSLLLVS